MTASVTLDAAVYGALQAELETLRTRSRASEARFERLTANLPGVVYQAILALDGTLTFTYASSGTYELFGVAPDAMAQVVPLVHPDDRAALKAVHQRSQTDLTDVDWEGRVQLPNGVTKWVQLRARPTRQEDDSILWDGLAIDTSDRRAALDALQQSEKFLQAVLDAIPVVVFVKRASDLGYDALNVAAAHALGHDSIDAILNKTDFDLFPAEVATEFVAVDRRVLAEGTLQEIPEEVVITPTETRFYRTLKVPLFQDGHATHLVGIAQDITDRRWAERNWQQQRSLLNSLVENAPVGIAILDRQFRFLQVNQAIADMDGWAIEDHPGRALRDIAPEVADHLEPILQRILETGEPANNIEIQGSVATAPDQSRSWLASYFPIGFGDGRIDSLGGIIVETTHQRQVEDSLRHLNDRYEKLASNLPGVVYHYRRLPSDPLGEFIYISPAVQDIYHLDPAAVQADSGLMWQCVHPEDVAAFAASLDQAAAAADGDWRNEHRLLLADGTLRWIQGTARVQVQPDGTLLADGILLDITDRKAADEALKELSDRFQRLTNSVPGMIYQYRLAGPNDEIGEFLYLSPGCRDLYGIEPATGTANPMALWGRTHPDDVIRVQRSTTQAVLHRCQWDCEYRILFPNGNLKWVQASARPRFFPDGSSLWDGLIIDITPRKLAEAALRQKAADLEAALAKLQRTQNQLVQSEKMSSLGQLVAGVAHEINNPVTFIFGNLSHANDYAQQLLDVVAAYQQRLPEPDDELADLIDEVDLDFLVEDLPKLLESMRVGAQRIREIVVSLRNFSRLDEAAYKAVDLHEGIDSTLLILQNRLKARSDHPGIQVIKNYGKLPLVECFAGQLNQVFMNILSNAIDALEERDREQPFEQLKQHPSTITITTERIGEDWLRVAIADNGPGMPPEVQQRIFDPFFTTKEVGKGTGLGMSISYQIVTERHHGHLDCQSSNQGGTQFNIEIPIRQSGRW
ncbi:MAG: hypothetical protein Fur0042_23970 [Cyanophyceae cyanobacterium]